MATMGCLYLRGIFEVSKVTLQGYRVKYNLAIKDEATDAHIQLARLMIKKPIIEIKEVREQRSSNQNRYLHLLLGAFGMHFGYTLEESKLLYKQINSSTYQYEKKGRSFLRSSADLSTDEMAKTIDKFRFKSAEQGCDLPTATDQEWLRRIENEISNNRYV